MSDILSYYDSYDEAGRLAAKMRSLEYARTTELMERFLPPPPAVMLDIGGASGIYACSMAEKGYEVHLIDPVPRHIEQAKEASDKQPGHPLASATVGDARELEWDDDSVDIALLMGPLYHLTEAEDRLKSLKEANRILKPGGIMFATYISRYASLLDGIAFGFIHDPAFFEIVKRDITDGQHRNPTNNPGYFTTAYFHHPDEIEGEISKAGLKLEKLLAIEGPGWLRKIDEAEDSDPSRLKTIIETVRMVEEDRSLLPLSDHIAAVARK